MGDHLTLLFAGVCALAAAAAFARTVRNDRLERAAEREILLAPLRKEYDGKSPFEKLHDAVAGLRADFDREFSPNGKPRGQKVDDIARQVPGLVKSVDEVRQEQQRLRQLVDTGIPKQRRGEGS